ncbi:uncharacterized protein BO97DRAFT_409611 [Aspergillus homomorphus CBS 101889]|uniref:Uncharacterized protein n=1 Tax=Aspergillus homomorphus (strain CBS 101889) TaxID=1450537 RepID=A0A395HFS4_ASPHC|nr:hypothetical protein BO97DRAFT_409611 [Aspergillus homomorphus CBS 101889]RAL06486.1 hypothetical protein BO97DRAFT_409611 [Aspergillus homomorphus CBS 101889]
MPLKMGNNVDTKRVPSVRSLKTSAPCRDKRKVSRIQQKTDVAKRKDHERSHEIWSFAAITFAFANYILRQAPPELRSKVEDFAQASPGLLTMIQNGPQMNIPPKSVTTTSCRICAEAQSPPTKPQV